MGRAKVAIELITNERSRRATFLKRSKGLKKKAYELHTLCGIDTLLICFGPHDIKPETWPEDPSVIDRIITRYRSLSEGDRRRRSQGLAEYFYQDKKNKKNNKRLNCEERPPWDDRLNNLSESSLGELLSIFDMKAEMVRERIELLEKESLKGKELMISQPVESEGLEPQLSYLPISYAYPPNPMYFNSSEATAFEYTNCGEFGCSSLPIPWTGNVYGLGSEEYRSINGIAYDNLYDHTGLYSCNSWGLNGTQHVTDCCNVIGQVNDSSIAAIPGPATISAGLQLHQMGGGPYEDFWSIGFN